MLWVLADFYMWRKILTDLLKLYLWITEILRHSFSVGFSLTNCRSYLPRSPSENHHQLLTHNFTGRTVDTVLLVETQQCHNKWVVIIGNSNLKTSGIFTHKNLWHFSSCRCLCGTVDSLLLWPPIVVSHLWVGLDWFRYWVLGIGWYLFEYRRRYQ